MFKCIAMCPCLVHPQLLNTQDRCADMRVRFSVQPRTERLVPATPAIGREKSRAFSLFPLYPPLTFTALHVVGFRAVPPCATDRHRPVVPALGTHTRAGRRRVLYSKQAGPLEPIALSSAAVVVLVTWWDSQSQPAPMAEHPASRPAVGGGSGPKMGAIWLLKDGLLS